MKKSLRLTAVVAGLLLSLVWGSVASAHAGDDEVTAFSAFLSANPSQQPVRYARDGSSVYARTPYAGSKFLGFKFHAPNGSLLYTATTTITPQGGCTLDTTGGYWCVYHEFYYTASARPSFNQIMLGTGAEASPLTLFTSGNWVSGSGVPAAFATVYVGTVPQPFCGASISVAYDAPTGPYLPVQGTAVIPDGTVLRVTFDPTPAQTRDIAIRFGAGSSATDGTWYQLYNNAMIGDAERTVLTTVRLAGRRNITASEITLRCYDQLASLYRTLQVGQASADTGDGRKRPCNVAMFYWPKPQEVVVGQSVPFTLSYSGLVTSAVGTSTTIAVAYSTFDPAGNRPSPTTATWTTAAPSVALGTANTTINAVAGFNSDLTQFMFRCTDALGSVYDFQWATGVRTSPSTSEDENCLDDTAIGVSPRSWVPGLVRLGTCSLRLSFVPRDSFLASQFGASGSEGEFDDSSAFYPITLVGQTLQAAADTAIVTDGEIAAGQCSLSLPFAPLGADGTPGASQTVLGMQGQALAFNTCADVGSKNVVTAVRRLGLIGAVIGFLFWAYRWASNLSVGSKE